MRRPKDDTPRHADPGNAPRDEPELREMKRIETLDRQLHVAQALEAGMTREEAERHADEDVKER
jgi:hypothetical protein